MTPLQFEAAYAPLWTELEALRSPWPKSGGAGSTAPAWPRCTAASASTWRWRRRAPTRCT